MKFFFIFITLVSFNSFATTSRFDCKFLEYYLELDAKISKHVTHELKINGKLTIKELFNNHWFIEEVNCKRSGYEIVVSHIQYSDPAKKVFKLTYRPKTGYKLVLVS
jgi:hypothetical protein